MPIILLLGDKSSISSFLAFFEQRNKILVHDRIFHESISDVLQSDPEKGIHFILSAGQKANRYIVHTTAKRFKTGYLVIYFENDIKNSVDDEKNENSNEFIEVPSKSTKHDNPLLFIQNYEKQDKNKIYDNVIDLINLRSKKKITAHKKRIVDIDFQKNIAKIIKDIQKKFTFNNEIFLETEMRILEMVEQNRKINVEIVYEKMLKEALKERGFLD